MKEKELDNYLEYLGFAKYKEDFLILLFLLNKYYVIEAKELLKHTSENFIKICINRNLLIPRVNQYKYIGYRFKDN